MKETLEPKFKLGDKVRHSTTDKFDMVIIGYCNYEVTDDLSKAFEKNYLRPLCKYYNSDTQKWEQECFNDFELYIITI